AMEQPAPPPQAAAGVEPAAIAGPDAATLVEATAERPARRRPVRRPRLTAAAPTGATGATGEAVEAPTVVSGQTPAVVADEAALEATAAVHAIETAPA